MNNSSYLHKHTAFRLSELGSIQIIKKLYFCCCPSEIAFRFHLNIHIFISVEMSKNNNKKKGKLLENIALKFNQKSKMDIIKLITFILHLNKIFKIKLKPKQHMKYMQRSSERKKKANLTNADHRKFAAIFFFSFCVAVVVFICDLYRWIPMCVLYMYKCFFFHAETFLYVHTYWHG